ncbi:hypothetical protein NDU88_003069 [Pleurodeles waltl]|uniref:Uncharacterized protein n=1 Tax=Pleurodeles waltl TaxID=8319 RepID=A0AAV7T3X1_PLEWA|nr:hypothetical protein NDU88_003069 [Pleurodeles waltl]
MAVSRSSGTRRKGGKHELAKVRRRCVLGDEFDSLFVAMAVTQLCIALAWLSPEEPGMEVSGPKNPEYGDEFVRKRVEVAEMQD